MVRKMGAAMPSIDKNSPVEGTDGEYALYPFLFRAPTII